MQVPDGIVFGDTGSVQRYIMIEFMLALGVRMASSFQVCFTKSLDAIHLLRLSKQSISAPRLMIMVAAVVNWKWKASLYINLISSFFSAPQGNRDGDLSPEATFGRRFQDQRGSASNRL